MATNQVDTAALTASYATLETEWRQRADTLMRALIAGTIGLSVWSAAMREELRRYHLAVALIATGGTLTAGIAAAAQKRIDGELAYFNRWAASLQAGTVESDAMLLSRMALYFAAGFGTLFMALTVWLGLPALPYQPGVLVRCFSNCRCFWIYERIGDRDWNLTWIRVPGDSCPTCMARERLAQRLEVRNGEVVDPQQYYQPDAYYFG